MYYKIRLCFDCDSEGCSWIEEYVNVENRDEAEKQVPQIAKSYGLQENYEIDIQETSIEAMIETEENNLKHHLLNQYILQKYDANKITIREYNNMYRQIKNDKEKYYHFIKDIMSYIGICSSLKKKIPLEKISFTEFEQLVVKLHNSTNEEYSLLFNDAVSKYKA